MPPLRFLYTLRDMFRAEGIRFAITSGMACVYYGLQQNTKDSDWIVHLDDLERLRQLLESQQRQVPPWIVSYRSVFGAPLDKRFLAAGWTSHLLVQVEADSASHHVDLFGKPPRLRSWEPDEEGFLPREAVAMMKRTDRDRDWPIVDGLGLQLADREQSEWALVHLQDPAALRALWKKASKADRQAALARRPLLALIDQEEDPDRLAGWIGLEREIWECVNRQRYGYFQRAWKEFYRRWRQETDWVWPTAEEFAIQHRRLMQAVEDHALPVDPMHGIERAALLDQGLQQAARRRLTTIENLRLVTPPLDELLP